jgi:hypothetical protein
MHVYHMQIAPPGGCGGMYENGEYFDIISSQVGDCKVRFKLLDYGGRVVLHCHILRHEDGGTMGWVNVTGGPTPRQTEVTSMTRVPPVFTVLGSYTFFIFTGRHRWASGIFSVNHFHNTIHCVIYNSKRAKPIRRP